MLNSGGGFFLAFAFLVKIAYLEGYLQPQKPAPKVDPMPSESRRALGELGWFISRLANQILVSLLLSGLVTLLIFFDRERISSSFLTGLLTLDSILIAVVALLTPNVEKASQFVGFMEYTTKQMHETASDPTKKLAHSFYSQLVSRSVILVVFLPIFAIAPFFLSAVLALVALLDYGYTRELLAGFSVWITLWSFLSIILAIWKLMMRERQEMKKIVT